MHPIIQWLYDWEHMVGWAMPLVYSNNGTANINKILIKIFTEVNIGQSVSSDINQN